MVAHEGLYRRQRGRRLGAISCIVAVLAALVWSVAPVSAARDKFAWSQSYDDVRWDCGYPVRVAGTESHAGTTREDKNLPGIVYVTDRFEFSETWTAADGRWLTLSGHGVQKDKKGKSVGGSVYEFATKVIGQPMVVRNSSGAVVLRDHGSLTFHYTIDVADGTFTFLGVSIKGPHPIFETGTCKAVASLVGTQSGRYLTPRPIGSTAFPMGFYEYLPPSYRATGAKSPLLVALNGYGESGDGTPGALVNLLNTGIPRFIDIGGWPTNRPLVVLALQHVEDPPFDFGPCDGVEWGGSCSMQLQHDRNHLPSGFCTTPDEVHDFITYALAHYNVDPKRVYVTGLSCGAFGGWEDLAQPSGRSQVAAAVLIAGEGRPAWTTAHCGLSSVPIWAFHGELDDVVNPQGSIDTMTHLKACPGVTANRAKLTVYPGLYHDGWDQAYSGSLGDDIYTWMLGFSKP